jgi:hypothetical protein
MEEEEEQEEERLENGGMTLMGFVVAVMEFVD